MKAELLLTMLMLGFVAGIMLLGTSIQGLVVSESCCFGETCPPAQACAPTQIPPPSEDTALFGAFILIMSLIGLVLFKRLLRDS